MKIIKLDESKLNSTEGAIVKQINENPDYFCSHSIQDVSKASNVSSSTMTRVCQKLGFKSFKAAQMFVYEKSRMQSDYYKLWDNKTIEQIIHNVRGSALFTINETLDAIDHKYIEEIASRIYNSKRVIVFGIEQEQTSINSFVLNLARIDIDAIRVSNIHSFAQRAVFFGKEDFCVFVTRTGWTKEIIEAVKWSMTKEIPILILTTDIETTKNHIGTMSCDDIYLLETHTMNIDKIKYPSISSVPGEMIIFDLLFNIIVGMNKEFSEKFQKTNEISLNWNFGGHL